MRVLRAACDWPHRIIDQLDKVIGQSGFSLSTYFQNNPNFILFCNLTPLDISQSFKNCTLTSNLLISSMFNPINFYFFPKILKNSKVTPKKNYNFNLLNFGFLQYIISTTLRSRAPHTCQVVELHGLNYFVHIIS